MHRTDVCYTASSVENNKKRARGAFRALCERRAARRRWLGGGVSQPLSTKYEISVSSIMCSAIFLLIFSLICSLSIAYSLSIDDRTSMFISHINTRWVHERPPEVFEERPRPTFHCASCDRSFDSLDRLRTHLRSITHLNQSISCPFCSRGYATGSGVVSHLEQGCSAAPQVNARTMTKYLKQADPTGYVVNLLAALQPAVLRITYAARQDMFRCKSCGIEVTAPDIVKRHIQAERESCFLFPLTLLFHTTGELRGGESGRQADAQGLKDTDKDQKYRCPNLGECDREFSTLAAAVNHLESERCGFPLQRLHDVPSAHFVPGSMGRRALQIPV